MPHKTQFQYAGKSQSPLACCPTDIIEVSDKDGFVVLPQVGDYISTGSMRKGSESKGYSGRVRSRYFSYIAMELR